MSEQGQSWRTGAAAGDRPSRMAGAASQSAYPNDGGVSGSASDPLSDPIVNRLVENEIVSLPTVMRVLGEGAVRDREPWRVLAKEPGVDRDAIYREVAMASGYRLAEINAFEPADDLIRSILSLFGDETVQLILRAYLLPIEILADEDVADFTLVFATPDPTSEAARQIAASLGIATLFHFASQDVILARIAGLGFQIPLVPAEREDGTDHHESHTDAPAEAETVSDETEGQSGEASFSDETTASLDAADPTVGAVVDERHAGSLDEFDWQQPIDDEQVDKWSTDAGPSGEQPLDSQDTKDPEEEPALSAEGDGLVSDLANAYNGHADFDDPGVDVVAVDQANPDEWDAPELTHESDVNHPRPADADEPELAIEQRVDAGDADEAIDTPEDAAGAPSKNNAPDHNFQLVKRKRFGTSGANPANSAAESPLGEPDEAVGPSALGIQKELDRIDSTLLESEDGHDASGDADVYSSDFSDAWLEESGTTGPDDVSTDDHRVGDYSAGSNTAERNTAERDIAESDAAASPFDDVGVGATESATNDWSHGHTAEDDWSADESVADDRVQDDWAEDDRARDDWSVEDKAQDDWPESDRAATGIAEVGAVDTDADEAVLAEGVVFEADGGELDGGGYGFDDNTGANDVAEEAADLSEEMPPTEQVALSNPADELHVPIRSGEGEEEAAAGHLATHEESAGSTGDEVDEPEDDANWSAVSDAMHDASARPVAPARPEQESDSIDLAETPRDRVVVMLMHKQVISKAHVEEAIRLQQTEDPKEALWRILASVPGVDREEVFAEAAGVYAFPAADLEEGLDADFARLVMESFSEERRERLIEMRVLPVEYDVDSATGGAKLVFATHDPARPEVHRQLQQLKLGRFEVQYAPEGVVTRLLAEIFPRKNVFLERMTDDPFAMDLGTSFEEQGELIDEEALEAEISRSTLINLFEATLVEAVRQGASDIHIFPSPRRHIEIHFRVDGRLHKWHTEDKVHPEAFLAVVKDNSVNVDRFERDMAQDGFIQRHVDEALIRFRVSVLPIATASQEVRAESIVIRVLDDRKVLTDLTKLGMLQGALEKFDVAIRQPHGMVILTGPTGSGKSTTLVAALHQVVTPELNVLTVEDPVEYIIKGVRQIKLGHKLNLDGALRAILRHDPDVVMVGEMRDKPTAELAIKLANTGHLTFSTLHTNDAPSAVSRLFKMGVEPFLIAYAINLVVAQRLLRNVCPTCRTVDEDPDVVLLKSIGFSDEEIETTTFYKAASDPTCRTCKGSGYKGRRAMCETLYFSREIRHLIVEAGDVVDEDSIREQAEKEGMLTLLDSAREIVKMGETTIEELIRVTSTE